MRLRAGEWIAAGALIALLGWPSVATIIQALRATGPVAAGTLLDPVAMTGQAARPLGLAFETLRVVAATEAIALPTGVLLALFLFRTNLWGRDALLALVLLALFVPLPLHATAWLGAIGNVGRSQAIGSTPLLVGWSGAAFVHAMAALPWVVLLAGVGLRSVEPELEESALLDLPAWRVALVVSLRRSVGAIAGAALAVAVLTAGDMTVTDLLQVRTYAEEAYIQSQLGEGPTAAAKVALPPLCVLGTAIWIAARALLRADPARIVSRAVHPRTWRLAASRVPLGVAAWCIAGGAMLVPIYGLGWRAGRVAGSAAAGLPPHWSFAGLLGTLHAAWLEISLPSYLRPSPLVTTVTCAAIGATLTAAVAWLLAWNSREPGPWRAVVAATAALALATPAPIVGMALKLAYLQSRLIHDTPVILVCAYIVRTLPYSLLVLWPALRAIPREYLEAAAVDGYGPWGIIRRVALPLSLGAIAAAWAVSFVLALGELPATNIVVPAGYATLSSRVWSLLHTGVESHLAGVGLVLLVLFAVAGAGAAWALKPARD
jgi:iron(III) transport system permease protein